MDYKRIYERLRELAPSVAFKATKELDEEEVWDGDGPDPRDDGFDPYVVEIHACTVVDGVFLEGTAYLSSCYYKDDEPIGDISGYLPQKLEEAAEELQSQLSPAEEAYGELEEVLAFLKQEMKDRYNEQRKKG